MWVRNTLRWALVAIVLLSFSGAAMAQDVIHKSINDTVVKVKATNDPVQKRAILGNGIDGMIDVLGTAERSPLVSQEDAANLGRLKATLQEKSDELAGKNGFTPVPDDQLNAFSDYVVQDMEQARETITISVVVLLLIIIIIILIV